MKNRKEIIRDILARNRQLSHQFQEQVLESSLLGLQDAMLFQIAENLGIHIMNPTFLAQQEAAQ